MITIKSNQIIQLYNKTLQEISEPNDWMSFLECASKNYKYPFYNQVLIYAQKPSAIACATMVDWNQKLKRWVNKGAKGIAILEETNGYSSLSYVFDVTDTNCKSGKKFALWTVSKAYENDVIEALENKYGVLEDKTSLGKAIISLSKILVEDNIQDYLKEENSEIENMATFSLLIEKSVAFSLMYRSGISPYDFFSKEDFHNVTQLKDSKIINLLGVTISDIAQMGIRTIYQTVKNLRIIEINKIRTFEKETETIYDKGVNHLDGRNNNDYLHSRWGLFNTEFSSTTEQSSGGGQIRDHETQLFEEPQESTLHESANEQRTSRAFDGNSEEFRNESRADSARDGEERERNGGNESQRTNEVDRSNEQLKDGSRGSDYERTNLQLDFWIHDDKAPHLYCVTDDEINQILAQVELKIPTSEVKRYFEQETDSLKRAEFIKNSFENTDVGFLVNKDIYYLKKFENGVLFWKGDFSTRDTESFVTWEDLTYHYDAMILLHQLKDNKKFLFSEQEQLSLIGEEQELPELEFSQEFIDKYFQTEYTERKYAIYRQYQESLSTTENIQYLKNLYGISGGSDAIRSSGIDYWTDSKGIAFYRGYSENKIQTLLKWNYVEKRIKELIKADRYLNPKELKEYPNWLENQKQQEELESQELIDNNSFETPKDIMYDYKYNIGDKVYIGADKFEILSVDNDIVRLYDYQFPLFNQEMSFEEFDKKVRENPCNNHLRVEIVKEEVKEEQNEYGEFNDEVDLVEHILSIYDMNDIKVNFNSNENIVMYSDDIDLEGKEVYDFLLEQLFEYNEDGTVDLVDNHDLERLKEYRQKYETKLNEQEKLEDNLIGKNVTINGREFIIDSINDDVVSLKDVTFQNGVGFPIFRDENLETVLSLISKQEEEKKKETIIPNIAKKKRNKVTTFDIHPEIKNEDRNNFHITDDMLGVGSDREKFNRNIEAIKVLKQCEEENRFATPEEQQILSQYVGWGGLPQAFDEMDSSWSNEYYILKNLLDETEYSQARESTLTAFYTPPVVIRAMYKALENMGLKTGNILEPSCGTGNFIGMLPNSLKDCKIYGVELDLISGRIARQLYQKSSVAVQSYEDTNLPNSFFDVAIGNVPFGDFKVIDKKYDKNKFLIHDYFFAKTLDKIRPGGVVAFITSKGTLDKENPSVRRYIAQRADLIGAIRLPNNTFKANAGTEVTSDIIFLQKRDSITDIEPDWVYLDTDKNGITMNKYFVDHPDMIMGNMEMISTRFGYDSACISDGTNLENKLEQAISNIHTEVKEYELDDIEEDNSIEADLTVKNFSYTILDNKIYFRENSRMYPQDLAMTTENRVRGLIEIRDCVRTLLEYQTEDYPEEDIKREQDKLNRLYDNFTKKYGLINSRGNNSAFSNDSSYYLLCSLEILDENGNLARKADMFTKRTIRAKKVITTVDTANDALIVSLTEKARIDLSYMQSLCGLDMDKMISDLEGVIFNIPDHDNPNQWVTADEYLSGNVREKLQIAEKFAETDEKFKVNVKYLKEVQPKDLSASEISVRLGATWIPTEDIKSFIKYLLNPSWQVSDYINVHYMESTSEWYIDGKNYDKTNVKANNTYGTHRVNAYKIIEDSLNLKDTRVYDYYEDDNGKKVAELNKKETAIAQSKQEQIKLAFEEWIWTDLERRERLVKTYNERFNAIRPREYDGSHIIFEGMNPEITLRKHQVNAIARMLYGGNTLLAHEVGAGKTYEMVAAAMEAKRLGLCNKSLFVVPNHLVEQFGQEFLQLYPSANILVTTKKDFETANRKKFCSRIATGDYDAVIISHSQFEKIPMSVGRQISLIQKQIDDITMGIQDLKNSNGERFSIKQLEKTKKSLKDKLTKLNDSSRKDDVITFEELGVDRLFVDEAHYYKNLFLYTKMRNVGGIAQTEAQKSSDLFMKCRYLDEITGGKGVVFATGTPVSNSMVELYTMQRYLQYGELEKRHLQQFDAWASTFGETVTAIELAPEGTGYRAKTRFAKFFNLPELMSMFKEVADIQTADMLNLPVPKANYHNVVVEPSEIQKKLVKDLSERAEKIRNRMVDPSIDNMLKITNDGRKLALDQRLANDMLEDFEHSKVATCADNIYEIWNKTSEDKSAQLVFCDLSTPTDDGKFNVYDDLKKKLIERGIPEEEIAFIHNANTDVKKQELFNKVRRGQVRVLMGSTQKMGAGTNCQDRLIALHDLDCPWRPSDLIQRSGRIIRQGNKNSEVDIYRYVTQGTFDAYLYHLLETKQRFISQIMTSKTPVRFAEDIDETALSYAEIKALATGNLDIIEKTELDTQVAKLKLLKQAHLSEIYAMEDKVIKYYPSEIKRLETKLENLKDDLEYFKENDTTDNSFETMFINGEVFSEKKAAGEKILEMCKSITNSEPIEIGEYKGFKMILTFDTHYKSFFIGLKNNMTYLVELGFDPSGNITRLDNALNDIVKHIEDTKISLEDTKQQYENAKIEIQRPFPQEEELKKKTKRLDELNIKLNLNEKDKEIIDDGKEDMNNSQMYEKDYER